MLNETQIGELLNELTAKLKGAGSIRTNKANPYEIEAEAYERVNWGGTYEKAKKHCEEIEVHAAGDFPKELLGHTFPNETAEEMHYRKKSFQPITEPYWKKALRSMNRIWAEQNYTVKWHESNEKVAYYFLYELPIYGSIISYFKQVVTTNKINDPNAVLVIDFDLPVKESAEGDLVIDDTKPIAPYPTIYCTEDVLKFEAGAYALLMSEEKSAIEYGGKAQRIGYVLYLYDNENIYRIVQIGKRTDWKFEATLYYTHGLQYLPCWKLKGTPEEVIDGELLYDSHFSPAIPYLNEAIIMHSTLKASISKIAYPIRAYYEQTCSAEGCNSGSIYEVGKEPRKCGKCNGSGTVRFSPLSDYVHEAPTATNDADKISFPGIQFVSPDSAILDFSKTTISQWITQAFLFLNIDASADGMKAGLGNNATATKSKIDREEQFVSMLDISNEVFELLELWLDAAYKIRYLEDSPITIIPPTNFELIGAAELTDELAQAKLSGMPDAALSALTSDYIIKRFSQNGALARVTEIARYCDAFFSKDDVSMALNAKFIQPYESVLHLHIYNFIAEKTAEESGFIDRPATEIKPILVDMAKAKAAELGNNTLDPVKIIDEIAGGGGELGKIPLAIQQLALARTRAQESGDESLAAQIGSKIDELLAQI